MWKGKSSGTGSVVTCAGQTDVVVQCFLMSVTQKLLSCAHDRSVKVTEGSGYDGLLVDHLETRTKLCDKYI